jgi:putative phage-type endonuclease
MPHVSTTEMSHEEWLAKRKDTIGSSDVGTILGLNRYATPRDLFKEKRGITPPFEGNDNTEWGTELEDFCAKMFEKKHPEMFGFGLGSDVRRVQRDNKIRVHPRIPFATCNIDRLIVGGERPVILELKTTTSYAVKNWDAAIPTAYYAQLQWQMFVTGYEKAIIWVAVLDKKQFIRLDVQYHKEFCDKMLEAVVEFRKAVEAGDDSKLPLEPADVEKMRPVEGSRIEATEEILSKITQLTELKARNSEAAKIEKALSGEVKTFIGQNEVLAQGERVIATYKMQHKDAYSVPASDYRTLNLQREKKEKK